MHNYVVMCSYGAAVPPHNVGTETSENDID